MTYILRTIDRQGDFLQLKQYSCIIRACSTAQLFSETANYGNVIVTNTRTGESLNFSHGKATTR